MRQAGRSSASSRPLADSRLPSPDEACCIPAAHHRPQHTRLRTRLVLICLVIGGALLAPGLARPGYGVGPSSETTGPNPIFSVFLGSNDSLATVYVASSTAMDSFDYFPTQELGSCTPAATATAGTYTCQPSFYIGSLTSTLAPGTYYWWLTFYENFKLQISGPLTFTVAQPVAPTGISLTSPSDGATVNPSVALTAHITAGTKYSIDVSDLDDRNSDGSAVVPTFACAGTAPSDGNYSCSGTSTAPLLPYLSYYWWVVVTNTDGSTFVFGPRSFTVATATVAPTPLPRITTTTAAPPPAPTPTPTAWVTTSSSAVSKLKDRFANIETASCSPDTSSSSKLIGNDRWWQRFLCNGATYGGSAYTLTFKATGECPTCWTISNLTGVSASALLIKSSPPPAKPTPAPATTTSGGSAETPEHLYATSASGVLEVASACNSGNYSASAFLVGAQTVVTDLHVVQDPNGSACASTVRQEGTGRTARIANWTDWPSEDLAVAHLSSPITGHDFSFAPVAPSARSKISGLGYSLGNPLSFNQGTVIELLTAHGIPYLALNLLGAHGSSGGPILNPAGRVVGVTDRGVANNAGLTSGINESVILSINLAAFAKGGPGMCKGVATESANTLCGSLK